MDFAGGTDVLLLVILNPPLKINFVSELNNKMLQ